MVKERIVLAYNGCALQIADGFALTYIKNQHVELGQFLNDGRIPLTTNLVEKSIIPFTVHRRAWLFADTNIIKGRDGGSFAPQESATRAEVAAVVERFIKTIMK